MPELPDLEIVKEVLQRRIVGLTIESARVLKPLIVRALTGQDFEACLRGQQIIAVTRRGKNLLLHLSEVGANTLVHPYYLVINPMLAGRLHHVPRQAREPRNPSVVFSLSNGMDLRYTDPQKMGKIYLTDNLALVPRFTAQGPEALDPTLTLDAFRARLRSRHGEIKGVLTDQQLVAGIGNAYADEILYRAGIYPFRKCTRLSEMEITRLYQAIREVLTEAISILRAAVGEDIHEEIRDFMAVHNRGGQACPRCGTLISEIRARQRITSFCRNCQPGTLVQQ